jgi:uncharacterized membrane protein YagU involved in acid resistance
LFLINIAYILNISHKLNYIAKGKGTLLTNFVFFWDFCLIIVIVFKILLKLSHRNHLGKSFKRIIFLSSRWTLIIISAFADVCEYKKRKFVDLKFLINFSELFISDVVLNLPFELRFGFSFVLNREQIENILLAQD